MNPVWPLILTVFFSLFHFLGGVAVGQAVRAAQRGSTTAITLAVWGAGMGVLPVVFDWFFLIRPGDWVYGLIGPIVFILAAFGSAFLELKVDGAAVLSAALGSTAFLLGIFVIPLTVDAASTRTFGLEDYVGGTCLVLMFVIIGGSFAWSGFSAMLRGISLDRLYSERLDQPALGRKRRKHKDNQDPTRVP